MTGSQQIALVFPPWTRSSARALAFAGVMCLAASCAPARPAGTGGTGVQTVVAELEQGRLRGTVSVSGIVTDDDPVADQTLLADEARGCLLYTSDAADE